MEGAGPDGRERQARSATPRPSRPPAALGAEFRALDFGDYPLEVGPERLALVVDAIREFAPDVLITHTDTDPFNPDHPVAYAGRRARALAGRRCRRRERLHVDPPARLFLFEPHQPELCNFTPTTFVDITAVFEEKVEAMAAMEAQNYLQTYYAERAEQRGNHARAPPGDQDVRYAEAFSA